MLTTGPFRPASDITSLHQDRNLWLVPGIIPENGLVILASAPKTGKTCFATALARAVALGQPFLGQEVKQGPVLWCAHEETPQERILLHEGLTDEDPFLIAYPGDMPPLNSKLPKTDRYGRRQFVEHEEPFIFKHALEIKAKLIVIDCLHGAVEGASLAENATARAVMGSLRVWSAQFNIAVLVLHHLTKSSNRNSQPERFADSAQILAAASCYFFMDRTEEVASASSRCVPRASCPQPEDYTFSRIVLHGKGRHPAPAARLEIVSDGVLDYQLVDKDANWIQKRPLSTASQILELLEQGYELTSQELARKLQLKPTAVRGALADLVTSGQIVSKKKEKENSRYALFEPENCVVM